MFGEGFAHQFPHAPQVPGASHEGSNLQHRVFAVLPVEGFQRVSNLLGKKTFGRKRRDKKRKVVRLPNHHIRQLFGKLQNLGLLFLCLFLVFGSPRCGRQRTRQRRQRQRSLNPSNLSHLHQGLYQNLNGLREQPANMVCFG